MVKFNFFLLLVCGLGVHTSLTAEIVDSLQNGFTIRYERTISADPQKVYGDFTSNLPKWWDPAHTYSGNASNLSVQPNAGGCFCENLDHNGSVQHMKVIYAVPGKIIRMEGGLGPLQQFPLIGIMTLEIKQVDNSTSITFSYAVSGYIKGGCARFAGMVDKVLGLQFDRFIHYVNSGK